MFFSVRRPRNVVWRGVTVRIISRIYLFLTEKRNVCSMTVISEICSSFERGDPVMQEVQM
jgi:hypothetical protein